MARTKKRCPGMFAFIWSACSIYTAVIFLAGLWRFEWRWGRINFFFSLIAVALGPVVILLVIGAKLCSPRQK